MWTISGSVEVWRIISPCYPGDGDMEELLGPASRDHPSVNLLMGDLRLDTALAKYWIDSLEGSPITALAAKAS